MCHPPGSRWEWEDQLASGGRHRLLHGHPWAPSASGQEKGTTTPSRPRDKMCCTHAQAEEVPFACHLLVDMKNYTPFPQGRARVEQELTPTPTPAPRQSRLGCRRNYISERSSSHRCEAYCFRGSWRRNGVTGGSAWLSWPDPSVASRASSVGRQHCLMPGKSSGAPSPNPEVRTAAPAVFDLLQPASLPPRIGKLRLREVERQAQSHTALSLTFLAFPPIPQVAAALGLAGAPRRLGTHRHATDPGQGARKRVSAEQHQTQAQARLGSALEHAGWRPGHPSPHVQGPQVA